MKIGNISAGSAETTLMAAASAEIVDELGLPVNHVVGYNDNFDLNFQSGVESFLCSLLAALSRADILGGLGSIGNATGVSAEKIVLNHDLL